MNLKIIKKTPDEVLMEFEGESHTLLNLLRTELMADERTVIVTYDNKFPVMAFPIFRLKTKGADPVDVMRVAAEKIVSQCDDFSAQFKVAVG